MISSPTCSMMSDTIPMIPHILPIIPHILPIIPHILPMIPHMLPIMSHHPPMGLHIFTKISHSPPMISYTLIKVSTDATKNQRHQHANSNDAVCRQQCCHKSTQWRQMHFHWRLRYLHLQLWRKTPSRTMVVTPEKMKIFFSFFFVFSNNFYMWKCPSSIWWWDSNPQPSEHESLPVTTTLNKIIFWFKLWLASDSPNLWMTKFFTLVWALLWWDQCDKTKIPKCL